MDNIEEARTNKEILDAYSAGSRAIKDFTQKNGLTVEVIDEVMTELQEVLADQKEIDDALKTTSTYETFNEEELQEELTNLMKEESQKGEDELLQQLQNIKIVSPTKEKDVETKKKELVFA